MRTTASLAVRPVVDRQGLADWLAVPYGVYADSDYWIAPLLMQERQRISRRHNPFFTFGEAVFWVAYRDGVPLGRISSQVNRRHLEQQRDNSGHFGFFDCVNDEAMASLLVTKASTWLRERGLGHMRGPFNLSINEDIGLLVSGFDSPPSILTSHAAPWAGKLLEKTGLKKEMDLFAYRMDPSHPPTVLDRLSRLARQSNRVRIRPFDMSNYAEELRLIFDIFNDAWSENWGFVPFSEAEITALVKETRPIMRSKFGRVVEIDGRPAAMMVVLPDLNHVIRPFHGRLLPFNWAKLAAAIWKDRWKSARIPLLGLRKEFQATPLAPSILSLLVGEFLELGRAYHLDWVEFSWVLETNRPMTSLAEAAAGPPTKIFRIYGMDLK